MADFDWNNAAKPKAEAFDWSRAAEPADNGPVRVTVPAGKPAPNWATEQEAPGAGTGWQDKVRAAMQGATLGFGDEAVGYLESRYPFLARPAADLAAPTPPAKSYRDARDENRELQEGAAHKNPWSAAAGSLLAPIPGVGSGAGIGTMAAHGAGVGIASALGGSHADLTEGDYGDAAVDMALGGLFGGAMGAGMGALSKFSPKAVADYLRKTADEKTIKAAGAIQSDLKGKLATEGGRGQVAKDLLDEGVVRFGSGKKAILDRAKELVAKSGSGIGDTLNAADEATSNGFDYGRAVARIRSYLDSLNPTERRAAGNVEKIIADLEEAATKPGEKPGFAVANDIKSSLQDSINYKTAPKVQTNLEKRAVGLLTDEIDSQMPEGLQKGFGELKRKFGSGAEIKKVASKAVNREAGNNAFGLTDYILAAAGLSGGLAAGHPIAGTIGAGALAVGRKLARERGDSAAAVTLDLGSKLWTNTVVKLAELAPDSLGKYGKVLARELQTHGPAGVLAMHHALSSDPQYVADQKKLQGDLKAAASKGPYRYEAGSISSGPGGRDGGQ